MRSDKDPEYLSTLERGLSVLRSFTREKPAMTYAAAVREEVIDLFAAGADIVQLDEPYMQARPEAAASFGIEALNAALHGVEGSTCVHIGLATRH
jgi:methionine synthase II (cobalamin-independent)